MNLDAQNQSALHNRVRRTENGGIDVMHAVGGVRGIIETFLPGFLFLSVFLITKNLMTSLLVAGAIALIFTLVRIFQKGSLIQSLSGLAGIAICAFSALRTGDAAGFYLPSLLINVAYALVLALALLFKLPLIGFLYGLVRGEEKTWRQRPDRVKAYVLATLVLIAMFVLRLAVQVPLYLVDNVGWLGATHLFMGTPLYALAIWFSWMVSRPESERTEK